MKNRGARDKAIGGAVAIVGAISILSFRPLSLVNTMAALLFAMGAFPAAANALAWLRRDVPSVPIFSGDGTMNAKARGSLGSILGPLSFVATVLLIWIAQ